MVRVVPFFLVCGFLVKTNSGVELSEKGSFKFCEASTGSSSHFRYFWWWQQVTKEIDSLKTTQILQYLVITPDLVQMTTHRAPQMPSWWGGTVSSPVPHRHPGNAHGLFSLAVWVGRRHSERGREGQCLIFKLLHRLEFEVGNYFKYKEYDTSTSSVKFKVKKTPPSNGDHL